MLLYVLNLSLKLRCKYNLFSFIFLIIHLQVSTKKRRLDFVFRSYRIINDSMQMGFLKCLEWYQKSAGSEYFIEHNSHIFFRFGSVLGLGKRQFRKIDNNNDGE